MCSLILAVIARISLCYSGRPLTPHWIMKYVFGLIVLAGSIRLISAYIQVDISIHLYVSSAMLWVLAYVIYVVVYAQILTSARPDGKCG
jgi:uncharacterized protein involved in response to NO